jgi:hypothetical protein
MRNVEVGMAEGQNSGASPVIGRGAGGAIGYATAVPGTADEAQATPAGVVGFGGSAAFGLFGRGSSGIVGYEQSTPRDPVFESLGGAGVVGRGPVGIRAEGTTGPGVHARGTPGLQSLSRVGPATVSEGQVGIYASGRPGPGVVGVSAGDRAAILSSRRAAQLWLIPLDDAIQTPAQLTGTAQAGELLVTEAVGEDGVRVATLWFCKSSGGPGEARWVKLA